MIKIISGYSEKGGSTLIFINLTNEFNKRGMDCIFYGPHDWHLDKCKSDLIQNAVIEEKDIVISHFLKLKKRPTCKKIVLSCHEKWWFDVGKIKQYWDEAIFSHQQHKDYHFEYKGKYSLIPNLKENLVAKEKTALDKVAGIIGSVEHRKQTHISIQRALDDGCEIINIIGSIGDMQYFNNYIFPILKSNPKVRMIPFQTNKQLMYDSIGRVYHSSNGEVACLVKDECYQTNTKFFGNDETEHEVSTLSNSEIINLWKKVLEL